MITPPAMRVTFVLNSLDGGGVARTCLMLARDWMDRGWAVRALTFAPAARPTLVLPDGLVVVGPGDLTRRQHPRAPTSGNPGWSDLMIGDGTDLVIALNHDAAFLTARALRGRRTPWLASSQGHPPSRPRASAKSRFARTYAYRRADVLVAMTEEIAAWYRSLGASSPIHVIPNPLDPSIEPVRPRANRDAAIRRILAVGSLFEVKGFDVLIRGFAPLAERFRDLHLRIVGEGPERQVLEELALQLGVADQVELPGHVESMREEYREADVFVLSSRSEGYANVLTEAWAASLPVVASDCGGAISSRLRHRSNCLAVPRDTPEAITAALAELTRDPALVRELADAGHHSIRENDLDHVFARWYAAIRATLT